MSTQQAHSSSSQESRQDTPLSQPGERVAGAACTAKGEGDEDSLGGCGCCGMSGTGGRIRVAILIVVAIAVVVLMVHGFASAG